MRTALVSLTPAPVSTPDAVELSGAYNVATQKTDLGWSAVNDEKVVELELRATSAAAARCVETARLRWRAVALALAAGGIGDCSGGSRFSPMTLPKLLLFLTLPLYILDQITKFWTTATFPPPWDAPGKAIVVIEDWFLLVRVHNQGVAFGFGNGTTWAPVVFLFVPIIALTLIRVFWKKGVFNHPVSMVAVALLLCGIFGNLTDRLVQGFLLEKFREESFWTRLSEGYVVDFVLVRLPLYDKIVPSSEGWWPAFNVADSCICIAAALLFIGGLREEAAQKRSRAGG